MRVGVISDTHGLLRPEALAALQGSDYILHAGDIGAEAVLQELAQIAEVAAIRGNIDRASWAKNYPPVRDLTLAGRRIYMLHDLKELDLDPAAAGVDIVVAGHSHKPAVREEQGVLYLNPGSAGPRRFTLPVTVATLLLGDRKAAPEILELSV